jgi:hypothetical protein
VFRDLGSYYSPHGETVTGNKFSCLLNITFGYLPHRILEVFQHFSKQCSCHPHGEFVRSVLVILCRQELDMRMTTAVFVETLDKFQYFMRLLPKSQSYMLKGSCENLRSTNVSVFI